MSSSWPDRDPIREEFDTSGFENEVIEEFIVGLRPEDRAQYRELLEEEVRTGDPREPRQEPAATRALERLLAWAADRRRPGHGGAL